MLRISKELRIDPDVILATSHGRRSVDVLEVLDPSKANWECKSTSPSASALAK